MISQEKLQTAIQLFPRKNGLISIWDHPNFKSNIVLPDDYKPLTRVEQALEMIQRGRLNEDQLRVLKIVGDAICSNQNQLRRYLSKAMSNTTTGKHLKYLQKYGFVERHKSRLAFIEEEGEEKVRPPAPYTLGIVGYKLLNHLYGGDTFASPDIWQQNSMGVQRYVAMNEVRCLAVESGNIRAWSWFPFIGGSRKHTKPFATFRLEVPNGELQVIVDRAQMSQNFIGYLRTRLEEYRYIYDRDKSIVIDGFNRTDMQIVAISVSSVEMATFIQEEINLHRFPFDVWFIVDEWFDEVTGMGAAIASVTKDGIRRLQVDFLNKKIQ